MNSRAALRHKLNANSRARRVTGDIHISTGKPQTLGIFTTVLPNVWSMGKLKLISREIRQIVEWLTPSEFRSGIAQFQSCQIQQNHHADEPASGLASSFSVMQALILLMIQKGLGGSRMVQ